LKNIFLKKEKEQKKTFHIEIMPFLVMVIVAFFSTM
jgi:hypothetical protein